jgi:hypothetical protein
MVAEARRKRLLQLLRANGHDPRGLAGACSDMLPELSGVGIVVMSAPQVQGLVSAAGSRVDQIEELQLTTGQGPRIDAYLTGKPVHVPDLSTVDWLRRWPGFTPAALAAGARAIFALPLQLGAITIGALGLYRDTAGPLSHADLAIALVCAEAATLSLLGAPGSPADSPVDARFDHRAAVHQATGMVMVQLGVGVEEAFVRLRAHAFSTGQALNELARDIVNRRVRLERG